MPQERTGPRAATQRRIRVVSDDVLGALGVTVAFILGVWNGWIWREIVARRRLAEMRHIDGREDAPDLA